MTNFNVCRVNRLLLLRPNRTMDVTEDSEVARSLQSPAEKPSILHVCQTDRPISFEAQMKEVEILRDNRRCWSGEVQRERVFHRSKVVELEDEFFGEVGLVPPDHPSNTHIAQTEFVATGLKLYK